MHSPRLSVYSREYVYLRQTLTQRRLDLGLSQRALAERLGVVHSFVGKVETGDRRLDVLEFIEYCKSLEWNPSDVLQLLVDAHAHGITHNGALPP